MRCKIHTTGAGAQTIKIGGYCMVEGCKMKACLNKDGTKVYWEES